MDDKAARLVTRIENGVGHIVFSNPARRNALTADMLDEFHQVLHDFEADDAVKVIALAGESPVAFSSGLDITGLADEVKRRRARGHLEGGPDSCLRRLQTCAKPTIAVIQGFCYGGGLAIALLCDLRITSSNASFCLPTARMAIGYSVFGVQSLVEALGTLNAREVLFTARTYTPAEAQAMGMVNRVFPAESFASEAAQYIATVAGGAPLSLAASKLTVRAVAPRPDPEQLARVQAAIERASNSEDAKEAQRAFVEKRPPQFKGR